jgi:hypothetical protein
MSTSSPTTPPSSPSPIVTPTSDVAFLPPLAEFISVAQKKYNGCISHIDHAIPFPGLDARLRLHYVPFDNARPKFKELASVLAEHVISYCITAQRWKKATRPDEIVGLLHEAASLFRRASNSGEPGELLLYFLLEAVLGAPQVICKMSLKTNKKDEVKGSDGIHIAWDEARQKLTVYFGESKLYQDLSGALTSAFTSMEAFHSEGAEAHEIFLASTHFNLLSNEVKDKVCDLMDKRTPGTYDFCHACFIGTDWSHYKKLEDPDKRIEFVQHFESEYSKRATEIHSLLSDRLAAFSQRHLRFEFFYIPFESVEEFRKWFFDCLPFMNSTT